MQQTCTSINDIISTTSDDSQATDLERKYAEKRQQDWEEYLAEINKAKEEINKLHNDTVANLKEEVDEQLQQEQGSSSPSSSRRGVEAPEDTSLADADTIDGVPSGILDNEELVHRILLTDPSDFHQLSWNGSTVDDASVDSFMTRWTEDGNSTETTPGISPEQQIAENMRRAFFDGIVDDMKNGKLEPVKRLILDLHEMMRKLIPNRTDLHSHLSDENVESARDTDSLFNLLLASANALANNLESPARASSTLEWIRLSSGADAEAQCMYGFASKEAYIVASCAFLLFKAEVCQMDIANYQLTKVAPMIHSGGSEYELRRFRDRYGLGDSPSIGDLKEKLPATHAWIVGALSSAEAQVEISRANSTAKRYACLKSRGFVDSLLFTSNQLAMPEIYVTDASMIVNIRNEARFAVIGCALGLHISNVARADPSVFATVPLSSSLLEEKRQALDVALRASYSSQREFSLAVAAVAISFVLALTGESSLTPGEEKSLKNSVGAVLRGFDPVLKLLDNRVKQFMRNLCKWQPCTSVPIPMQTGRSLPGGAEGQSTAGSTKALFMADAMKEASKSGFSLYSDKLVDAGDLAYRVADVSIKSYGDAILDRLLVDAALGTPTE